MKPNFKLRFDKKGMDQGLLKKYKFWSLYLSGGQYFLGKVILVLNRKNVIDFSELKKPEVKELHEIIKEVKKILVKCFQPDLFNYATLGNFIRQHHWHIVPRYKSKREINGVIFKDEYWGKPCFPTPDKKINKKTAKIIKDLILKKL